ncbi:MAG: hypothetical protein AAFV53_02940 [Myxococcota bacterium]
MNRFLFVFLCCGVAQAARAETTPQPSPLQPPFYFMPAIELGVAMSAHPEILLGLLTRTSLDVRLDRIQAPFIRITYDNISAQFSSDDADARLLVSNVIIHDIAAGGGYRFGDQDIQLVTAIQGGVQIGGLPVLLEIVDGSILVDQENQRAGLIRGSFGIELYVDLDAAVTLDVFGQRLIGGRWPFEYGWSGGLTIGLTTAL